ncbi:epoxide hydrolase [Microlunatus elymi]|uniref:Epoxide hydrolase n=1 Tax=Microlunatus elymi TaxID=2596828 RepID=A0A516PUC6_9ACTN|nr:epoxide hydrolase family protein [Microlunatus elymi]QDP94730.1 epoxide hydrolase [Microlunatus elymi]
MEDERISPFRIEVSQADLDDLQDRLRRVRWAPPEPVGAQPDPSGYGVSVDRVRGLVEHWRDRYDWRRWEARLNAYPQFVTSIDGQRIHFLRVRSPREDALPLLLTHGWPGSVVEFLDIIDPLTEPATADDPAFDLVIPSLPGFGWSGSATESGWGPRRIAGAWSQLMARLGYRRYGVAGNDWGSVISPEVGRIAPDRVVGVHVTQLFSAPDGELPYSADPPPPADIDQLSAADRDALAGLREWQATGTGYHHLQATQPQTLAHALSDSPVGLLGWVCQVMDGVDPEFLLTNVSLHWLTGTGGSAIRIYREGGLEDPAEGPTTVPLGLAQFAADVRAIRHYAERDHARIVSWHSYSVGGHYAAHQVPDVYLNDLRGFFAERRAEDIANTITR